MHPHLTSVFSTNTENTDLPLSQGNSPDSEHLSSQSTVLASEITKLDTAQPYPGELYLEHEMETPLQGG